MNTAKVMPLHRKWLFILAALVSVSLVIVGGIMYQEILMETQWSVIGPIAYVSIIVLCIIGLLRLIYTRGFPE
ncbi:MAG: hypothetical protein AM325_015950 [Candidatus Thorarchaeota archaeon SMTZ1-45]